MTYLNGQIDSLDAEMETCKLHAWKAPAIGNEAVAKACFELQLKGFNDAQEAYRVSLRACDAVLAFGGAMVAWLATFIVKQQGLSFWCAILACTLAGLSIVASLIARLAPTRPAIAGSAEIMNALHSSDEVTAYDWLSRILWVNRRGLALVIDEICWRSNLAIYFQCLAVAASVVAVCTASGISP